MRVVRSAVVRDVEPAGSKVAQECFVVEAELLSERACRWVAIQPDHIQVLELGRLVGYGNAAARGPSTRVGGEHHARGDEKYRHAHAGEGSVDLRGAEEP